MHIIVPMSGSGERFRQAGYESPKPLIIVDEEPMIRYVVSMFSPQDRYTFICNSEHLQHSDLSQTLKHLIPESTIIGIAPHKKGPVWAVSQCLDAIDDEEETIVCYCDFYSYFDLDDFLRHTRNRAAAGAIAAYRGFHPHMLGSDNYAFIKQTSQWLEAIQEKKPFTEDRMSEYASNGLYYFARGAYIKTYFTKLIESGQSINGEFYVSMVYNLMVSDQLPVSIYEVQHMLQWGTPQDLQEYQHWSDYFRKLTEPGQAYQADRLADICLIPMAGRGARFAQVGYQLPKPLIPVSGKPMIVQACQSLPGARRHIFVTLQEHNETAELTTMLENNFSPSSVVTLNEVTDGQASTCQVGLLEAKPEPAMDASVLIGACDNAIIYDEEKFDRLLADRSIDAAAFTFRNHPSSQRNPQMYGWLSVSEEESEFPRVLSVSVKKAISDNPRRDHAIVGAFFFRKISTFMQALDLLKQQDLRVNNEFYVDSLMGVIADLGMKCVVFEVDDYICFGTPNDLRVFEYWQSFFHKCPWHPYKIEKDCSAQSDDPQLHKKVNARQTQQFE